MRLTGSFQTIVTHGVSGSTSPPVAVTSSWTGAMDTEQG
jgi:hypothetical protein